MQLPAINAALIAYKFKTKCLQELEHDNLQLCDGLFSLIRCTCESTVKPRLSGLRLSGLFNYPDFFSGSVFFFMNINKL